MDFTPIKNFRRCLEVINFFAEKVHVYRFIKFFDRNFTRNS